MASNYSEQLVIEGYEYQGYFIRNNVLVGKRAQGGYETELAIVAFHPKEMKLVHLEPSMDADSWERREERYKKKFDLGRKYIPGLFVWAHHPKRNRADSGLRICKQK
jgi:nitrate reductase assembly molybdenum cofactor insertion protein NarJ